MKNFKQEYVISAPVGKVWEALVDPKIIDDWGGGPAKMDDRVGTKFELWGGDIHGTNTRIETNRLLEQDWFGGEWDEASKVTFKLSEAKGATKVELIHGNVPDSDAKDIENGWRDYYLGPLKELLEN